MSVTEERDDLPGGGPQKAGVTLADLFIDMYATVAVLTNLRAKYLIMQEMPRSTTCPSTCLKWRLMHKESHSTSS